LGNTRTHGRMLKMKDRTKTGEKPEAVWKEFDCIGKKKVRTLVFILRTRGCRWADKVGCTMCGYHAASVKEVTVEDLRKQLHAVKEKYEDEEYIKIYTSGSFLDTDEIPLELRKEIFDSFENSRRILVESRPEFITEHNLTGIDIDRLEIAIGLETADDRIRERCVRKGFTYNDYLRAAALLKKLDIPLRTYLLLKPPFLTEREAIIDAVQSIKRIRGVTQTISINPVNVQKNTLVERLWKRGNYRPPWLWSLIQVLETSAIGDTPRIFSAPTGAGTPRGIHNCGKCDGALIRSVRNFSFSQNVKDLDLPECECMMEWKALLELQNAMSTSVDINRYLGYRGAITD